MPSSLWLRPALAASLFAVSFATPSAANADRSKVPRWKQVTGRIIGERLATGKVSGQLGGRGATYDMPSIGEVRLRVPRANGETTVHYVTVEHMLLERRGVSDVILQVPLTVGQRVPHISIEQVKLGRLGRFVVDPTAGTIQATFRRPGESQHRILIATATTTAGVRQLLMPNWLARDAATPVDYRYLPGSGNLVVQQRGTKYMVAPLAAGLPDVDVVWQLIFRSVGFPWQYHTRESHPAIAEAFAKGT